MEKGSWFFVRAEGKNFTRCLAKLNTRADYKPYVADTKYRDNGPVLTEEEEIKRGEAGDPLLITQLTATKGTQDTRNNNIPLHQFWIYEPKKSPSGETVDVPAPNKASGQMRSSMIVQDQESGIYLLANAFINKRYDLAEAELLSSLPPTVAAVEKIVDAMDIEEPMRSYLITKLLDKFNLKFLSAQENLRAFWNTILHVGNVEYQELCQILDDATLRAVLSYQHYQREWHKKYGDFSGTKYVMYIHRLCIF